MAETATVGELLVRIRADVGDLERGLAKAQGATTQLTNRTKPGLRAMQNAFAGLAFSATGLPGPLGRLSRTLLMFAGGGAVTVGVLAGIGALGLAWRGLVGDMERIVQEADAVAKAMGTATEALLGQEMALHAGIAALERRSGILLGIAAGLAAAGLPGGGLILKQLPKINEGLQKYQQALERLEDKWLELDHKLPERLRIAGLNEPSPFQPGLAGAGRLPISGMLGLRRGLQPIDMDISARIGADRWIQAFAKDIREKYEISRAIGESIGYALADGINAVLSGGNFLKALGRSLLSIAINVATGIAGRAIGNAIFPGGGEAAGLLSGGGGGTVLGRAAAPTRMVDFSNFPAATNPLASARDGDWLRFLGASNLQLRQYGFR